MNVKLLADGAALRTFILVLDTGDEACAALTAFAAQQQVTGASFVAVGAFKKATVGWFDLTAKRYRPIAVDEQCEVLTLAGDIAIGDDGAPSVHAHTILGLRDGSTRGGHLMEGLVRPTLEVTLSEAPVELRRHKRPELGVALIDLSR